VQVAAGQPRLAGARRRVGVAKQASQRTVVAAVMSRRPE
jgi:hypothetical protein